MKINKVIEMISNNMLFKHDDEDVKEMLINNINKKNSVIGNIIINLLVEAEKGSFE